MNPSLYRAGSRSPERPPDLSKVTGLRLWPCFPELLSSHPSPLPAAPQLPLQHLSAGKPIFSQARHLRPEQSGSSCYKCYIKTKSGASLVAQWLSLPANAGDTGSSPALGGSHMPRSNWAREPQLLSLRVWSLCSATREAVIVRGPRTAMKSGPRSPQLGKALAQKRRPNTAINE